MPAKLTASLIAVLLVCSPGAARADLFVLSGEGIIQGELVNKSETPREKYVIDTVQGGRVTLAADQVVEVRRESAAQQEYEKVRGQYPDTVEGNWQLAEWCRQNLLLPSREVHLKRVLELDPDHEAARRGLGYSRVDGKWATQDEIMTGRGYVRYKGKWMLPQEVELLEASRRAELAEKEWFRDIKRWRQWLNSPDKAEEGLANIRKITDPNAVKAIRAELEGERNPEARQLWLETLSQIGTFSALDLLVQVSLEDRDHETRLSAIDELARRKNPEVVNLYVKALKSKDNATINRAALGLAAMEDRSAIAPLIEVLVTTHKFKITQGSQAISSTFPTGGSGGPGGLSMGSKTSVVTRQYANEPVRDALVKLAGVNYNFDVDKWKLWLAAQQKEDSINIRRD